ncbi:hypothetical protein BJX99DRAFT_232961 [Aspergillus californicus]
MSSIPVPTTTTASDPTESSASDTLTETETSPSETSSPTEESTSTEDSSTTDTPTSTVSTTSTTASTETTDTDTTTETTSTTTTTSTSTSTSQTTDSSTTTDQTTTTTSTESTTTDPTTTTVSTGTNGTTTTVVITSTDTSVPTTTTGNNGTSSTIDSAATASATETGGGGGGSGLSAGGTIAVAVVVPVVSVALLVLLGLWLWRRYKAKKVAEEERRKEVEEYGFNPNDDPTLPAVIGGAADDTSGYRGWGTTSAGRKASTNMSSSAGAGLAMSEAGSQPGYHHAATPSDGTIQYPEGHGALGETEPYGILGAAPVAAATNQRNADINRGPSNASSAYSAGNHSDVSEESHMSATHPGGPYFDENPYYTDTQQQYGGYNDPYGGGQPVIRDVQARRNTQIQNPSVFPRQGNAGIAQNF